MTGLLIYKNRRMSALDSQVGLGLCRKCGKTESEHFLIDDVLYCDEPVVSPNEKITLGRMATIHNIPEELHIERSSQEEHDQLQKLTAMVKALEKHCGISSAALGVGVDGDGPVTQDAAGATLSSPKRSSPSSPKRASLSHIAVNLGFADSEQHDAVQMRGKCGGCGLAVLATHLRYVEGGCYYHQVSLLVHALRLMRERVCIVLADHAANSAELSTA